MSSGEKTDAAPQKPSLLRQLVPWLIAGGILAYIFHEVDFQKLAEALKSARASWVISAFLAYCAVYYLTDILSFARTYRWFNTKISFSETARLRFASFMLQAVNGALTEIMMVLYMLRVKKVLVLHASSSALFIYFNETLTLISLLAYCAFFLPAENRILLTVPGLGVSFWSLFQALVVLAWVLGVLWLVFWRTKARELAPKLRDSGLLMAFKQASLLNYGEVFFYRLANNLFSVFMNIIILRGLGIKAPLTLLFAAVPVMVNVAYFPVSAGGFGGPQLAAHFLLKGYASEESILAYSLVWSSLFFLTRTFTGLPFMRPVYRAAFPAQNIIAPRRKSKEGLKADAGGDE